jgi:hypothetical protein
VSSTAESEHLRVVSNWSAELKNPAIINLQSSRPGPMPSVYATLYGVNQTGTAVIPER